MDQFSRTELLIGCEALHKLQRSTVAIYGVGGVGSYVVEGLARAGVGQFVLIDHDTICVTNINRQIHATHSTLGLSKVEIMKQRILDINPKARVTTHMTFYTPESSQETLIPGYDYIVDAIDNVAGKVDLAVKAEQMGLPIISSMGTGNKLDPTRLEVADIYDTSVCPLAKAVRKLLKERGVKSLKVVYSREQPIECGRVTGSLSFVPSVAGMILAAEVVKDLVGITPRP